MGSSKRKHCIIALVVGVIRELQELQRRFHIKPDGVCLGKKRVKPHSGEACVNLQFGTVVKSGINLPGAAADRRDDHGGSVEVALKARVLPYDKYLCSFGCCWRGNWNCT